ncbi:MAG: hypothetical protein A3H28_14725 [Acidobacteria bacterium RIFCSPLOWO2_02_FULL_61_28]|nr:MAG: hypothetical protein A3H28_14725 [Acidobacteria bacterium RIFCSPLOWO2_02_FULL_61_28]
MRNRLDEVPRRFVVLLLFLASLPCFAQKQLSLPNKPDSLRFAVMGDTGTGGKTQYDVARQMVEWRTLFPFEFVLMMGDNLYGGDKPKDYQQKFEIPYKPLMDAGVKFYASLGNHDDANQRFYKNFNMNGERYYTFRPKLGIRFFALDSNYMDRAQLAWLQEQLRSSGSEWKIFFFHQPLYSSGDRHGSDEQLRAVLEPLFVQFGVSVVFSGHDHFYERIKPQKGIYYFVSGAGGQLRRGNIRTTDLTAKGFDQDNHFMILEIAGDEMYFQTISRTGTTVDSGVIQRPKENLKEDSKDVSNKAALK